MPRRRMIGKIGTARAAFAPIGAEHEMIDDQLAAAGEEIAESLLSRRRIEYVILLDLDPGECAPFGAKLVAGLGQRLLLGKMRLPRREPLVLGYDFVLHDQLHEKQRREGTMPPRLADCLGRDRRHPADTCAARLAQDGDAADAWDVE